MNRDPVSAIFRLSGFAREKELPDHFKEEFKAIKDEQLSIKPDELEKWKNLYIKALLLSEDLKKMTESFMTDFSMTKDKVKKEDVSVIINDIQKTIPCFERATKNAVAYVKTSRIERQKVEVLKNIKNAISDKYINVSIYGGLIHAHFNADWKVKTMDFIRETLEIWRNDLLKGLVARIAKEWDVYRTSFNDNVEKLSLPSLPEFEINYAEDEGVVNFPDDKEEKLLSFGTAFVKTMRSSMGIIMMSGMVLAPFGAIVGVSRGDMRSWILLIFVPIIIIMAIIMGKKEAEKNTVNMKKKLTSQLIREMEKTVEESVNEKHRTIKGDIDRFVSESERIWNRWVLQMNKLTSRIAKENASSNKSSVKISSRIKYMSEDLEQKIIPELENRIKELGG